MELLALCQHSTVTRHPFEGEKIQRSQSCSTLYWYEKNVTKIPQRNILNKLFNYLFWRKPFPWRQGWSVRLPVDPPRPADRCSESGWARKPDYLGKIIYVRSLWSFTEVWIRIHSIVIQIRIRIQHFKWIRIRIQGFESFDQQKLKKIQLENCNLLMSMFLVKPSALKREHPHNTGCLRYIVPSAAHSSTLYSILNDNTVKRPKFDSLFGENIFFL